MTGAEFLIAAASLSAATSVAAGAMGYANYQTQKQAAQQNSRLAVSLGRRNAALARQNAAIEEARVRRDRARRLGAARAAFGATGLTMQGTPLLVLADQAREAEEAALLVRYGGAQAAQEARLEAALAARRENAAATTAGYNAWGSLIGGTGQAGATLLGGIDEARRR